MKIKRFFLKTGQVKQERILIKFFLKITGHGESVQVVIAGRQRWIGVIAALVVVVLDIEAAQFRVFDAQRAARIVNILSVQRLI